MCFYLFLNELVYLLVVLLQVKFTLDRETIMFPTNGIGSILFFREETVKFVCDTLATKRTLFLRSPPGSGKTVFLKLLGSHLQKNAYRAYWFNGSDDFLSQKVALESTINANEMEGCKTVFFVDEICPSADFGHRLWLSLLKPDFASTPYLKNVFFITAGVSTSMEFSRLFDIRFDAQLLFYKAGSDELEEVIAYWQGIAPLDILSSHQVSEVVKFIRNYTGGHPYPFFKFCQAFFFNNDLHKHASRPQEFICSKELFNSNLIQECLERCNYQNIRLSDIRKIIFNEVDAGDSIETLSKTGFWNLAEKNFTSSLVLNLFHNSSVVITKMPSRIEISAVLAKDPLLQRIYAGFCTFKEVDFMGPGPDYKVSVENSISAKWGVFLHAHMPTVFITSQARASAPIFMPGATPTVDFLLNGRDRFAIEFSLNGYDLKKKVEKFENGYYKEWKGKYAIVNVITNSINIAFGEKMRGPRPPTVFNNYGGLIATGHPFNNIYQFVTQTNKLYKGTKLVISNVSVNLPTPP